MEFIHRLKYYLIGVGIGSVLVFFMFGSRNDIQCSYFPNERVLKNISQKNLIFSPKAKCQFDCLGNDSSIVNSLVYGGDVDFKKSDTKKSACKTYYISTEKESVDISSFIENCDSNATILYFESTLIDGCNCPDL